MNTQIKYIEDLIVSPDGTELNYCYWYHTSESDSANFSLLLLLNDFSSDLHIWDNFGLELVNITHTVVDALEQRWDDRKDQSDSRYNISHAVEDVYTYLDWAMVSEPHIIIGHGWGATTALAYTMAHPKHVAGLVLIEGGSTNLNQIVSNLELTQEKALKETEAQNYGSDIRCPILVIQAITEPTYEGLPEKQANQKQPKQADNDRLKRVLGKASRIEFVNMNYPAYDLPLRQSAKLAELINKFFTTKKTG